MPESRRSDFASREIILAGENALSKITIPLEDAVKRLLKPLNAAEGR